MSGTLESQTTLSPTETLWAQVLRKDKLSLQPRSMDMPHVPVAPVDRNATSARILLYDTQARLEQFSSRADTMLKAMQDANYQLKTIGMLFEKDRDTLTNDMIDLVNRSQTQIQKAVGQPAQESRLTAFQEKIELRVEGLNQRLDALQMFNQTHCQALETHSQILKSIQDQQNALLSAVLPLLPLIQGFSSQLEQIKTRTQETNSALSLRLTDLKQDFMSTLSQLRPEPCTHKRRLSGLSTSLSPIASKRVRTGSPASPSSDSMKSDSKISKTRSARTVPRNGLPVKSSATLLPIPKPSPLQLARQRSVLATPHRKDMSHLRDPSVLPSRSHSVKRSPLLRKIVSPPQKTIFAVLRDPSIPKTSQTASTTSSKALSPSQHTEMHQLPDINTFRHSSPIQTVPQGTNVGGIFPISTSVCNPALPSFLRASLPKPPHLPGRAPITTKTNLPLPHRQTRNPIMNVPAGLQLQLTPSIASRDQVRERRSPAREGRRFIPLDDDDDDDDDEEGEEPVYGVLDP